MNMRTQDSMFLYPTNEEEVAKIIANLRVSSPGWDEISAKVIINAADILSKPLTFLYNLSLQSGIFPSELKLAKVIPLHKGDSKHLLNDYRTVSVLPVLSKILEKIVYSRLVTFINKHNILYNLQFGFREGHSTSMALMLLVDKIFSAIDDDEYVLGVFLDFSKALDCLDHGILLKKLEVYGVRGTALSWFQSYLTDRQQFVYFDDAQSEKKTIVCGVSPGVHSRSLIISFIYQWYCECIKCYLPAAVCWWY